MDDIVIWINNNIVGVSSAFGGLIFLLVRAYKFAKHIDGKFETIATNQQALQENITSDEEIKRLVHEHERKIQKLTNKCDDVLADFSSLSETLATIDNKLSAITAFLVNDPSAHEKITVIYNKYKQTELEKLSK